MKINKYNFLILVFCFVVVSLNAQEKKPKKHKKEATLVEATPEALVVEGLNLGNKAPEIEMTDPSGQIIKLSSLKGKIVLIDFWASWCRPCRMENPAVVAAWTKYKDQKLKNGNGFTIYSVSLDQNKEAWQMGITTDGLVWPSHVSDLLGWNNTAAMKYGVGGIPTNFLIDGDGIIIGKVLRGGDLEKALENLLIKN